MNILIADDERPARGELHHILSHLESGATFFEATNGQQVLACLDAESIDVIFLDINMPGMSGLAVAATIMEQVSPPLIVFATAYDVHAVRAFELAAVDYVVKPIAEDRLAQTMVRIRRILADQDPRAGKQGAVRSYLHEQTVTGHLAKLWAERENKTGVLVDYQDILWVVAEEKRVYVQIAEDAPLIVRYTLKELEERLLPHNIVRVHKAYLVNLNKIAEIVPWFSGTYQLRMADAFATEIPMSRQYAKVLKERLG
ncbi:MAG: LytTR family DNA-binding domain-containing protein [Chloroflexota bacterium]